MKLNYATMALAGAALLVLVWRFRALPWTAWRIAGLAILIPALVLLTVARIQLGRAFSVRARAQTLVTSGIYSRVRHPIYIFGALTLTGVALVIGKPWLLLGYSVVGPLQLYRARREEKVLAAHFGSAYTRYKQQTWF